MQKQVARRRGMSMNREGLDILLPKVSIGLFPGYTEPGVASQLLALTPMAKRSTSCIFGELMTVVRLRGSPNMSPSVSTTMTFDAFSLEPRLGVKMLSLNRERIKTIFQRGVWALGKFLLIDLLELES